MLNGRLLAADDASAASLGDGSASGRGVFETIKLVRGQPVFFTEHCSRLAHGASALGLLHPATPAELRARCAAVIAANPPADAVLKIVVFADAHGTHESILTRENRYTAAHYERGFRVMTLRGAASAPEFAGLKTLARAACRQALQAAQAAGCDEAVFIHPAGEALEGTVSNLFAVCSGRLVTPPLTAGILPGIVRAQLLQARDAPRIEEAPVPERLLREADEIFLTNSLLGVMPVARLDDRALELRRNPITRTFAARYAELEAVDLGR
jgi:branched-subunit amino acid aminotransferase/4-amino-4-deoxychorismate lyase